MNFTDIMNDMDIKEYVTETAKAALLVWLKDTMLWLSYQLLDRIKEVYSYRTG